jgi:ADP-ribose pyrophosphatase YjhB (NUDIX family)
MPLTKNQSDFIKGNTGYLMHVSLDCVVFGFHENQLKILLLQMKHSNRWSLPGGFVHKNESIETAADRVLKERTGLDNIFLQQFHVFSDPFRSDIKQIAADFKRMGVTLQKDNWLLQRFLTVGFYALVDFSKVQPKADEFSVTCELRDITSVGELILDHNVILDKALEVLRSQLNHQPVGYNLLPDKFTMPELQKLYETILAKTLDRRNFQRRMLGFNILRQLKEKRKGVAHKAPYLYKFDLKRYEKALKEGLSGGW